jgi:hypothetical protein
MPFGPTGPISRRSIRAMSFPARLLPFQAGWMRYWSDVTVKVNGSARLGR